jgi:ribosome-binding factor A
MKPFSRSERVGGLIQEAVSELLQKSIKDPRLYAVTVTGVDMTRDLKIARIYFVTSSGADASREEALAGFQKAQGFIKYSLAQELNLRYMPEFQFFYDESIDYGFHIDAVIKRLKNEDSADCRSTDQE